MWLFFIQFYLIFIIRVCGWTCSRSHECSRCCGTSWRPCRRAGAWTGQWKKRTKCLRKSQKAYKEFCGFLYLFSRYIEYMLLVFFQHNYLNSIWGGNLNKKEKRKKGFLPRMRQKKGKNDNSQEKKENTFSAKKVRFKKNDI